MQNAAARFQDLVIKAQHLDIPHSSVTAGESMHSIKSRRQMYWPE